MVSKKIETVSVLVLPAKSIAVAVIILLPSTNVTSAEYVLPFIVARTPFTVILTIFIPVNVPVIV